MAHNVIMPKTGMAMEEGTLVRWLKQVGEKVAKGEAIAVIETDKVTMELESDYDGTLLAIVHGDGDVVKATNTIAWVGAPGEKVPEEAVGVTAAATPAAAISSSGTASVASAEPGPAMTFTDGKVPATPAARAAAAAAGIPLFSVAGSGPGGAVRVRDLPRATAAKATPLARKVAEMNRVDLVGVEGSGSGGRIRRADVDARVGIPTARHVPAAAAAASSLQGSGSSIPFSGMRRAIAETMLRSHQQVPAVTLVTRADVTELADLRARMNGSGASKVSYTDFVVRAVSTALREHPLINSTIQDDKVVLRPEVDIGIAVALDAGLIVPVIRGADCLSVRQISDAARVLAERARAGALVPDEYTGGTFTITNLGMYGITEFTPLINVPESAILGVGAIEEAFRTGPSGAIEGRKVMSLCLTHDHRHIDGAPAAAFLGRIRALLENCWALVG